MSRISFADENIRRDEKKRRARAPVSFGLRPAHHSRCWGQRGPNTKDVQSTAFAQGISSLN